MNNEHVSICLFWLCHCALAKFRMLMLVAMWWDMLIVMSLVVQWIVLILVFCNSAPISVLSLLYSSVYSKVMNSQKHFSSTIPHHWTIPRNKNKIQNCQQNLLDCRDPLSGSSKYSLLRVKQKSLFFKNFQSNLLAV